MNFNDRQAQNALDQAYAKHQHKIISDRYGKEYRILDLSSLNPEQMESIAEAYFNREYYFQYSWLIQNDKFYRSADLRLDDSARKYLEKIGWQEPSNIRQYRQNMDQLILRISPYFPSRADDSIALIDLFLRSNLNAPDYSAFCRFLGGQMDDSGKIFWIQRFKSLPYPENLQSIKDMLDNIFWCMEEAQNSISDRLECWLAKSTK